MKNGKNGQAPDTFEPKVPLDLIGGARSAARKLLASIRKKTPSRLRVVFYGDIGAGKTSIAKMIAAELAAGVLDVERVHGRNVTLELVRRWQTDAGYSSLFGGWKIKLINELDLMPPLAQDLMLDYLDELPKSCAVLATSNLDVATLTTRFQTRFQLVKVTGPDVRTLSAWLVDRWHLPKHAAAFIGLGACGNVRAALNDAQTFLQLGTLQERPKAPTQDDWRKLRSAQLREDRRKRARYPKREQ